MRGINLPNLITISRIGLALVVPPLLFHPTFAARLAAFIVFFVAAVTDLWDGYLARSQNLITDLGKLLDPIADKLLLVTTFVPLYVLSHGAEPQTPFPWPGEPGHGGLPWDGGRFPLWIVVIIFGRELFITLFRGYAAKRGVVLAAGQSGKYKAVCQNVFIGAAILWYALHSRAFEQGWGGQVWMGWRYFHFGFTVVVLSVAVVLTVYSMVVYLREYRTLNLGRSGAR
jgi:phosphatidylglycerophosphate synthase